MTALKLDRMRSYPDRAAWLAARRLGIGGSDVPAILGLSPYKTPLGVWAEKVGTAESPDDSTYSMERGHHMEPFIALRLENEVEAATGEQFATIPSQGFALVRHAGHECLAYSPDGFATTPRESTVLCEYKSHLRGHDRWKDGVPEDVMAQIQHGLDVCGLTVAYAAVDLGNEFRWARVERDDALIEERRPRLLEFWALVESETPPPPTGSDEDKAALAAIYPRPQAGKTISLPGEFLDLAWELAEAKEAEKAVKSRVAEIENRVRAAIGDAEVGILVDGSGWRWRVEPRKAHMVGASEPRVLRRFGAKKER